MGVSKSMRLVYSTGGSGGCAEEGWSNGSQAEARETLRARILRDEAVKAAGSVEEEADVADPILAEAQAQFTSAGINEGGAVVQGRASRGGTEGREDVSAGEQEKRRKGKGIMVINHKGPTQPGRILKASSYNLGSDSWDPLRAANQAIHKGSSFSSKDADSRAMPEEARGGEHKNKQPQINEENLDMGGEGRRGARGSDPMGKGKKKVEEGDKEGVLVKKEASMGVPALLGEKTLIVISDDSEGRGEERESGCFCRKQRNHYVGSARIPKDPGRAFFDSCGSFLSLWETHERRVSVPEAIFI